MNRRTLEVAGVAPSGRGGPGVPLVEVFADDPGSPEERAAFDAWLRVDRERFEVTAVEADPGTRAP